MNPSDSDKAADFLEAAFFGGEELLDQATVDLSVELPLIDGYKLLRLLGEGGFGMVYEAEQRAPIRRRVALKVLRPGHTTRELLARFEQERQVLALLNHPHIAKVFDAGETEDGRPFIAMELVKGRTIDRHARGLGLREKVALMRDVSRAVGHAHHKGIIHRDLKPSNILITKDDHGPSEPRVIDFGIAKALDGPLSSKVMFTQIRQVVGTPGYMSPERQHTSKISQSADTRADVFALGAILWELLTGKTPTQVPEGGELQVTLPNEKECPAELRWITGKATDGDMERRYANADGLADDLDRFLDGSPIVAAPKSAAYLLSKWARRNRALTVVALVSSVALLGAMALILKSYQQANDALAEVERSRAGMKETFSHADYLMGMTRARRRPVHAMAQWARALETDPSNRAALGMLLATWGQRSYPHPIAPAAKFPGGKVSDLTLSTDGMWVALVMEREDGSQSVARCRRGEAKMEETVIPADGEITAVAVSNEGVAAVAGVEGPVGILQRDGSWRTSEHESETRRGLHWTEDGMLWTVSREEVAWLESSGASTHEARALPVALVRWAAAPSNGGFVVGMDGGRLAVFVAPGEGPDVIQAPIRAPVMSVALSADGTSVAASWRNGEIWVRRGDGAERTFVGAPAIALQFSRDGLGLVASDPNQFRFIDLNAGVETGAVSLDRPLRSIAEGRDGMWVLTPSYGPPLVVELGTREDLPGFGTQVRVVASAEGHVFAAVDEEHGALEWLGFAEEADAITRLEKSQAWSSVVPSMFEGNWRAVDGEGWVSEANSAGGVIRGWRCSERPIRLASVDAEGRSVLLDLPGPAQVCVVREGGEVTRLEADKPSSLALSGDGRLAVLGLPSGESILFDALTGASIMRKDWQRGPVSAVTFVTPERVALAFSTQIRVWDWRTDVILPSILDFSKPITALAADPSGSRLAAAGAGDLHVIDIASGLRVVGALSTTPTTACLAWEGDGSRIWSFPREGAAQGIAMPPAPALSPSWLPGFIEGHIGMHVNGQGRVVRLRSTEALPAVPAYADPALKAWLVRPLR